MPNSASERLRTYIDRVGRESELSERELARVRAMFIAKGISLDADAAPYREMIADTIRNLRSIQANSERAKKSAEELRESQTELQTRLQEALRRLQAASSRLQQQAAAIRKLKSPHELDATDVRESITGRRSNDRGGFPTAKPAGGTLGKSGSGTNQTATQLVLSVAGIPVVAGPKELQ